MFNKRFVYFAEKEGNVTDEEAIKKGPVSAQKKLEELFIPKADQLAGKKVETEFSGNSLEEEAARRDDAARADIIALSKEGKKFTTSIPGVDKDTFTALKSSLATVPVDHFATKRTSVEIDGKSFFCASIYDTTKKAPIFFYKLAEDYTVNGRDFLKDIDDTKYEKLIGKKREKAAA